MEKEKKIPFKNYILLAVILILTIMVVIYFFIWHNNNEENNLKLPIMDKYLRVINYNELDNFLVENKDSVIYISVLNSKEIRNFEKKFKVLINDYSLNSNILYLNLNEKNNNTFKSENKNIQVPSIIVYKNGEIISYFNIEENNYNINLLKEYLIEEGIIKDD